MNPPTPKTNEEIIKDFIRRFFIKNNEISTEKIVELEEFLSEALKAKDEQARFEKIELVRRIFKGIPPFCTCSLEKKVKNFSECCTFRNQAYFHQKLSDLYESELNTAMTQSTPKTNEPRTWKRQRRTLEEFIMDFKNKFSENLFLQSQIDNYKLPNGQLKKGVETAYPQNEEIINFIINAIIEAEKIGYDRRDNEIQCSFCGEVYDGRFRCECH